MKTFKQNISVHLVGLFLSLLVSAPVVADDIEIYIGNADTAVEVKPNLVFIVDTSGSMSAKVQTPIPYDVTHDYKADGGCFDPDRIYFSTGTTPKDCGTDDWFNKDALKCDAARIPMFNTTSPVVSSSSTVISDTTEAATGAADSTETITISATYDAKTDTTVAVTQTTVVTTSGANTRTVVTEITTETVGPALGNGWFQDRIAQWKENTDPNREEWDNINNLSKDWMVECKTDFGIHGEDSSSSRKFIANRVDGPYNAVESKAADWNATGRGYVLYSANYLNWVKVAPMLPYSQSPNRLDVVKDVTYNVVDSSNNINIGLMRFDSSSGNGGYEGGPVRYPVLDVTESRNDFKSRLKTMNYGGATPLSEVLYENYLYWAGKDVYYGNKSNPTNSTGVTLTGSGNKTYESPIKYTCQKNFNIYLSDGDATSDGDADALIKSLPGFLTEVGNCVGNCLDELAEYMNKHDVYDGLDGNQTVATYTVGFAIDHALLKSTAERGGAKYYKADNAAELTEVFNKIIAEILSVNTTFSSPAVSINAFNRTTHRNELYFTLFKPAIGPHWNGNLKRFKLTFDSNGTPLITDFKSSNAINPKTGFFDDLSHSWWTDVAGKADGGEVAKGGAAAHIISRTVYTYTDAVAPVNVDLTSNDHRFHEDNTKITDALLNINGTDPFELRNKVIRWARGLDAYDDDGDGSTTDDRQVMGDPLHSEPALIQYGGTDANPDITAYVATNDGALHAIDTESGKEIFSFIPQEMLPLQRVVAEDIAGQGKAYGLDGSVAPLVIDNDKNGVIDAGDKVYIFFGQRRGGNHYYAMDVTNRAKPILMWKITGGAGDYKELGQSWSNIQVKRLKISGKDQHVVVFAGGYDTDQDSVTVRTADNVGRAVYIADALGNVTGQGGKRLWWAGPSGSGADLELAEMKYSMPARLKAVDVRGNGYLDRMYIGDMGGQIWRFDIKEGTDPSDTLDKLVTGVRMADFAIDGDIAHNRRFYYPPDVAFIAEPNKPPYLALAFSSGYRAHPLERKNQDRVYMVRDEYLFEAPPSGTYTTPITEADLYDATDNTIGEGATADIEAAVTQLNGAKGWYVILNELDGSFIGEKGLSEVLIIEGQVIATTYIPQDRSVAEACAPTDGKGRVYFMNIADATPVYNFDKTVDSVDKLTRLDRYNPMVRGGIPPGAAPIFTKDGSAVIVGTETVENPIDENPKQLFWYEK